MKTDITADTKLAPTTGDVKDLDREFEGLIETWVKFFEPSEEVKAELDELDIDY